MDVLAPIFGSLICAGYVSGCWPAQGRFPALRKPVGDETNGLELEITIFALLTLCASPGFILLFIGRLSNAPMVSLYKLQAGL